MLPPEIQDSTVLENPGDSELWTGKNVEGRKMAEENNNILNHDRQQPDNNFKWEIPQIGVRNVGTWANILSTIQLTKV